MVVDAGSGTEGILCNPELERVLMVVDAGSDTEVSNVISS